MEEPSLLGPIVRSNVKELQEELAAGTVLNEFMVERGHDQEMPLHFAIKCDHAKLNVIEALIRGGADVNARTRPPKDAAAKTSYTPLMLAASEGRLDVFRALLAARADPNEVFVGAKGGELSLIDFACRKASKGHEGILKLLLEMGVKPPIDCLSRVSTNGSPGMVRMLLEAGLDVNGRSARWAPALHCAVGTIASPNPWDERSLQVREEIVTILLQAGADVNYACPADDRIYPNQSPLDVARAAKKKNKKIIAMLEAAAKGIMPAPPAPPPPPTAKDLPAIWKRLKKALPAPMKKSVIKGAGDEEITAAAKALHAPAEELAFWGMCNGQKEKADGLFADGICGLSGEFILLSLEEMQREWNLMAQLLKGGEFTSEAQPDAGVRSDWWNKKWIPFATGGDGNLFCLDLAPDKAGTTGQIIAFLHDAPERRVLAPSLAALLAIAAEHWESEA